MALISFKTRATGKIHKDNKVFRKKSIDILVRIRGGGVDTTTKAFLKIPPTNGVTSKGLITGNYFEGKDDVVTGIKALKNQLEGRLLSTPEPIPKDWLEIAVWEIRHPGQGPKRKDGESLKEITTLYQFIEYFIDRAGKRRTGKNNTVVGKKQINEYRVTYDYLKDFARLRKRVLDWKDITPKFGEDFIDYLSERMAINTVGRKVQTLKTILNHAAREEYPLKANYKDGLKTPSFEPNTVYLDKDELKKIMQLDLSNFASKERVRDLFIIGCWTGLRYSDYHQLDLQKVKNNKQVIEQTKTRDKVVVPILPLTRHLLEKYGGKPPKPVLNNFGDIKEVMSNQKFNASIKAIVKLTEIDELVERTKFVKSQEDGSDSETGEMLTEMVPKWDMISSHTARRSFATNLFKDKVPVTSIRAATGHSTEAAFFRYIRMKPEEHADSILERYADEAFMYAV